MSKIKELTEALLRGEVDIDQLIAKVEKDPEVQLNDILEKMCPVIKGLEDEKVLQMKIDSCFLTKDIDMKAYMVGFLCGSLFIRKIIDKKEFENDHFRKGFSDGEKAAI